MKFLIFFLSVLCFAQNNSTVRQKTVATLGSAASQSGRVFIVYDCITAADCSTGGGTYAATVKSNGTSWVIQGSATGADVSADNVFTGNNKVSIQELRRFCTNNGTGTTLNRVAILNGVACNNSSAGTDYPLGIVMAGAGTSGTATVTFSGIADCDFSGAATTGHWAVAGFSGQCTSTASPSAGIYVIGRVLETTGGSGLAEVLIQIEKIPSTASSAVYYNLAGTVNNVNSITIPWNRMTASSESFFANSDGAKNGGSVLRDAQTDEILVVLPLPETISSIAHVKVRYYTAGGSGNVRFSAKSLCFTSGETFNSQTYTAATEITSAYTSQNSGEGSWTSFLLPTGCSGKHTMYLSISRLGSDGADTLASDIVLGSVQVKIIP